MEMKWRAMYPFVLALNENSSIWYLEDAVLKRKRTNSFDGAHLKNLLSISKKAEEKKTSILTELEIMRFDLLYF